MLLRRLIWTTIAVSALLVSCRHRKTNRSELRTFSAHATGYSLEIESELELLSPDDPALYDIVLWNLEALQADNLDSEDLTGRIGLLKGEMTRQAALASEVDKLKISDPTHWIKEQLKYAVHINNEKVIFSVNQTTLKFNTDPSNPRLLRYKAELIANGQTGLNEDLLQNAQILLPRNPLNIFFRTNNSTGTSFSIASTKDRDAKFPCFKTNGYAVAPFNYFDFFNPYDFPECKDKYASELAKVTVSNVQASANKTVYPEYHELWKDNVLNVTAAFNQGARPWGLYNFNTFVKNLREAGYTDVKEHSKLYVELKKILATNPPREIRVRAYYRDSTDGLYKILADGGELKRSELVFYSGHSGYGRFLEDLFNKNKNLPERQYQLFFFMSCRSFSYGVSHIFANKAFIDYDLNQYYSDVISTTRSAYFHYFEPIMTHTIKFFENSGLQYGLPGISDLSYQYLIRSIDEIEENSGYKAHWTIAGEERNVFDPKKKAEENTAPQVSVSQIEELFESAVKAAASIAERGAVIARGLRHNNPKVKELATRQTLRLTADQFQSVVDAVEFENRRYLVPAALSRYRSTQDLNEQKQWLAIIVPFASHVDAAMNFALEILQSSTNLDVIKLVLEKIDPDESIKVRYWSVVSPFLTHPDEGIRTAALCNLKNLPPRRELLDAAVIAMYKPVGEGARCAFEVAQNTQNPGWRARFIPIVQNAMAEALAQSKNTLPDNKLLDVYKSYGPALLPLSQAQLSRLKSLALGSSGYSFYLPLRVIIERDGQRVDPILIPSVVKTINKGYHEEISDSLMTANTLDPQILSALGTAFQSASESNKLSLAVLLAKFSTDSNTYSNFVLAQVLQKQSLTDRAQYVALNYAVLKNLPATANLHWELYNDPQAATTSFLEQSKDDPESKYLTVKLIMAFTVYQSGTPEQKSNARAYMDQYVKTNNNRWATAIKEHFASEAG